MTRHRSLQDELDNFWNWWIGEVTGGDGLTWVTKPAEANGWQGKADIPRLCGNGAKIDKYLSYNYFKEGGSTVRIQADDCGKAVRCRDNSHCQDSKIGVGS